MQYVKKCVLSINDYILKIKLLANELKEAGYPLTEEEKPMSILSGLDESYDNVFFILTKRMFSKIMTVDNAKALLLSHECRLDRYKSLISQHYLMSILALKILAH